MTKITRTQEMMIRVLELIEAQDIIIQMFEDELYDHLIDYGFIMILDDSDETQTFLTEHGKQHLEALRKLKTENKDETNQ